MASGKSRCINNIKRVTVSTQAVKSRHFNGSKDWVSHVYQCTLAPGQCAKNRKDLIGPKGRIVTEVERIRNKQQN